METADLAMEIVNGETAALLDAITPYATGDETVVLPPCQPTASARFIHAGRSFLMCLYGRDGNVKIETVTFSRAYQAHGHWTSEVERCKQAIAGHTHDDDHGHRRSGMPAELREMLDSLGIDPDQVEVKVERLIRETLGSRPDDNPHTGQYL